MEHRKECSEEFCLTCSDTLRLVRVIQVEEQANLALIEEEGQQEEIDISLVEHVLSGDILLIHGGVALGRQEEPDAKGPAFPAFADL